MVSEMVSCEMGDDGKLWDDKNILFFLYLCLTINHQPSHHQPSTISSFYLIDVWLVNNLKNYHQILLLLDGKRWDEMGREMVDWEMRWEERWDGRRDEMVEEMRWEERW